MKNMFKLSLPDLHYLKLLLTADRIAKLPLLILLFSLPLVAANNFTNPFDFPKILVSLILIILSGGLYLITSTRSFSDTKLSPLVFTLFLIFIFAAFFGNSLTNSIFGVYPQFDQGILQFLVFGLVFFLLTNLDLTLEDKKYFLGASLLGLLVNNILIILQLFNLALLKPFFGDGVINLTGSPESLRMGLLLLSPVGFYFSLREKGWIKSIGAGFLVSTIILLIFPQAFGLFQYNFSQLSLMDTFNAATGIYKTNFLTGAGPANFVFAFDLTKPPTVPSYISTFSQFFNYWVNLGVLGGLTYTGLIMAIIYLGRKKLLAAQDTFEKVLFIPVIMFLVYQFIAPVNFFINLYFWIILGLVFNKTGLRTAPLSKIKLNVYTSVLFGSVALVVVFFVGKVALADGFFKAGLTVSNQPKDAGQQIRLLASAVENNPFRDVYQREYARALIASLPAPESSPASQLSPEQAESINRAVTAVEKAVSLNPQDKQNYIAQTQVFFGAAFRDQSNLIKAVDSAKKAVAIFPNDPALYQSLAVIYQQVGLTNQAEAVYKKLMEKFPGQPQIHKALADFYESQKQYQNAINTYQKADQLFNEQDLQAKIQQLQQLDSGNKKESTPSASPQR